MSGKTKDLSRSATIGFVAQGGVATTNKELKYCVKYASGNRRYFWTLEAAKIEVFHCGGIAIYPPKYAD